MELVYLWVEDYKNIHKQGFNFSPQFNCKFHDEYDENGKLKDNCKLEIKENDDYIENFFGENINVTAIVGKNGSGKSSILELIPDDLSMYKGQYFLLFKYKNIIYYLNNIDIEKIDFKNKEFHYKAFSYLEFNDFDIDFETIYIEDYNKDIEVDNSYERDEFHVKLNVKVLKSFLSLTNIEFLKNYNIAMNQFKISIRELKFNKENDSKHKELIEIKEIIDSKYEKELLPVNELLEKNFFVSLVNIFEKIDSRYLIELKNYINNEYKKLNLDFKKVILMMNNISIKLDNNFTTLSLEKYIQPYRIFLDFVQDNTFQEEKYYSPSSDEINPYYIYIDINKNVNILKDFINRFSLLINHLDSENHSTEILKIIDINLKLSNEIEYYDLSTGEQQIYSKIIEIMHQLKKHNNKNVFYILDEPDNHLHPEWSRKFIFLLINILKNNIQYNMKNIHFIITTHSPFLLSDIPKQNIIFLDRYKENDEKVKSGQQKVNNCKVVDGLSQTFGANIHTLLSDSFFMEDGLMGEFAKGKINEIKEFYEKVAKEKKIDENIDFYNKHQEKFWQIQKIIGEPFLKKVIKNYLDELELLFSDNNTLIEKELADIEKRKIYLESLKNAKN